VVRGAKVQTIREDSRLEEDATQPDIYIWYFLLATNEGEKDSLEQGSRLHHNNCFCFCNFGTDANTDIL
jgi:hypothetical protein